jgi:hypothetical protein
MARNPATKPSSSASKETVIVMGILSHFAVIESRRISNRNNDSSVSRYPGANFWPAVQKIGFKAN